MTFNYPFAALVDQEKVKSALIMSAIDPGLGGVLVTGPKGSGKSTIIRSFGDLLPRRDVVEGCPYSCEPGIPSLLCPSCNQRRLKDGDLPSRQKPMRIVECPVGVTEDSLLGDIDVERALREGVKALSPGILGRANGNFLYVDGINLLPDHIVDAILDPAASGWVKIKREGLSIEHPAKFTLIASMNPEEGTLRPQILDRFALKVEIDKITDPQMREEIIRRNIAFDDDPSGFRDVYSDEQEAIKERIERARRFLHSVEIGEGVMRGIAETCSRLDVEGLRSDISIMRAARALAAYEGKPMVGPEEVYRTFEFAVTHRIRKGEPARDKVQEILSEEFKAVYVEDEEKDGIIMDYAPDPSALPRSRRTERKKRRRLPHRMEFILPLS